MVHPLQGEHKEGLLSHSDQPEPTSKPGLRIQKIGFAPLLANQEGAAFHRHFNRKLTVRPQRLQRVDSSQRGITDSSPRHPLAVLDEMEMNLHRCSRDGEERWRRRHSYSPLHASCLKVPNPTAGWRLPSCFPAFWVSMCFGARGDIPVMIIFVGLTLIYAIEVPTRLLSWSPRGRLVGLLQFVTGIWLTYCTYAVTVDLALNAKPWV